MEQWNPTHRIVSLARATAGRAERAVRRALGRRWLISVVVPFKDVEAYFDECLTSILTQANVRLELILVDDGSVDGSRRIAEAAARGRQNVIITDSRGQGPGAARNTGLALAGGDFLTFVDSDDVLPPGALDRLLSAALRGNPDVVVGAFARFNSTRLWHPRWLRDVHARERLGTTVAEFPALLRSNYGCGKLYRLSFWRAQGLSYDEAAIYEDQPLIAQMLWRAQRIHVLDRIVYNYRARDDRSSVSQRPEELKDLRCRIDAWHRTLAALHQEKQPQSVVRGWYDTLYRTHFHWYLNSESIADPQYWDALRQAYLELSTAGPSDLLGELHPRHRIPLLLLGDDLRAEMRLLHEQPMPPATLCADGRTRVIDARLPAQFASYGEEPYVVPAGASVVDAALSEFEWTGKSGEPCLEIKVAIRSFDGLAEDPLYVQLEDGSGRVIGLTRLTALPYIQGSGPDSMLRFLGRATIGVSTAPSGGLFMWVSGASVGVVPISGVRASLGRNDATSRLTRKGRRFRVAPPSHRRGPAKIVLE